MCVVVCVCIVVYWFVCVRMSCVVVCCCVVVVVVLVCVWLCVVVCYCVCCCVDLATSYLSGPMLCGTRCHARKAK